MADDGDCSSKGEKSKLTDNLELESTNKNVRSVYGNFLSQFCLVEVLVNKHVLIS
jgi:hypothetical protein